MKLYLVYKHDPGYMTSMLEKIFIDGLAAGKYVREMNELFEEEAKIPKMYYTRPWYTVQVREVE